MPGLPAVGYRAFDILRVYQYVFSAGNTSSKSLTDGTEGVAALDYGSTPGCLAFVYTASVTTSQCGLE
jgi:hypothetical protein